MIPVIEPSPVASTAFHHLLVGAAESVPFIARIAGLPASVALAFRSDRCREEMEDIHRLSQALASLRAEATDRLFEVLPQVPAETRPSLLAIKRDCFNGREIRHRSSVSLERLQSWIGDVAARIVAHEEQLVILEKKFESTYAEARDRVRELLLCLGEDPELRRGLTLASRDLVASHQRLAKTNYISYGRKERGAERSLARYIIRTAVKLSPYSTLTKLGLGAAVPQAIRSIHLSRGPWESRSLVRLKSYLPDQWIALLLRIPQIRGGLRVAFNDTLEDLGDSWYRFIRPWTLQWNEESQDFEFVKTSLAKVRLRGPLIGWLNERLGKGPVRYMELCSSAVVSFGANREDISSLLDQFLDIGILKLLPPWPTYEPYPEEKILEFLETSPIASLADLDPMRGLLRRLVAAQKGYASADDFGSLVQEIDQLSVEIFAVLKKTVCPGSGLVMEKGRHDIYEDVLVYQQPDSRHSRHGEILYLNLALADELLRAGDLLWRIRGLYERRHECLHTFWHVARQSWPTGMQVPFLQFFGVLEDTWKLYIEHLVNHGRDLFNPYDLDQVKELGTMRASIDGEIVRALEPQGEGYSLPEGSLRSLLTRIPASYQSPVGACLVVQPADPAGELWVAHRIADGNGHLSSRFSALMHQPLRDWFTGHFIVRSSLTMDREPVKLLDLLFTQLTSVNRHWPQTDMVFETPGESADLPLHRVLKPSDLLIEIGKNSGDLQVRDRNGSRYLPCFLSALHRSWIPTFIKFLTVFGIDSRGGLDISAPIARDGEIECWPRLTVGRLVFRRKRWIVPIHVIPRLAGKEAAAFAAVWRWRRAAGLPDRVFWIESLSPRTEGLELFKPQFVDFNSPTLVSLFLDGINGLPEEGFATFEEALPTPEAFPKDDSGEGWGTELLLEDIAFQSPSRGKEPQDTALPHGEASPEGNLYNWKERVE
jgi:hypothetical protein